MGVVYDERNHESDTIICYPLVRRFTTSGDEKCCTSPSRAGVFSADMIAGFLTTGNLASEGVGRLAEPVAEVFRKAYQHGIRNFVLLQDTHHSQASEFRASSPFKVPRNPKLAWS